MPLTHELCEQAALEAFNDKWFRRNYLAMAEKYGGVTRAELQTAARVADMGPRLEVVHGIALEMEQRIGSAAVLGAVDWRIVVSASALAGLLSLLTSIAGLPEVPDSDGDGIPDDVDND